MRGIAAAALFAGALVTAGATTGARAGEVPPVKGNDTGGIIAYSLVGTTDVSMIAADHCAQWGKVARLTGVQAYYGGYLSFSCVWAYPEQARATVRVRG